MQIPENFDSEKLRIVELTKAIEGHLTDKEMHFLFAVGALRTSPGDILEIGSYKGRSTVLLSKAAELALDTTVYAVDPLTLPSETDPQDSNAYSKNEFYDNIKKYDANIVFYEKFSFEIIDQWDKPLRFLWIDGDHTYRGVQIDYLGFAKHLVPGGIIAFHDVLNGPTGPLQVFTNEVLQNKEFGACGVVGSIGWAQYIGDNENLHLKEKEILYIKLIKLLPHLMKRNFNGLDKFRFKLKRHKIPHQNINAADYLAKINLL